MFPTLDKPQKLTEEKRNASELELFYDLAFIAAIATISRFLEKNVDLNGVIQTSVMWLAVWWSWSNFTYFSNLFALDTIHHRIIAVFKMMGIVALGAAAALEGGTAITLTYSYFFIRGVLMALYITAMRHGKVAKRHNAARVLGFSIGCIPLVAGIIDPQWIWISLPISVGIDVVTDRLVEPLRRKLPMNSYHLMERFSLLSLIVIGEMFFSIMRGVWYTEYITLNIGIIATCGIISAFSVWWLFFGDTIDTRFAKHMQRTGRADAWIYNNFIWGLSLIGLAAGYERLIVLTTELTVMNTADLMLISGSAILLLFTHIFYEIVTLRDATHPEEATRLAIALGGGVITIIGFTTIVWPNGEPIFIALAISGVYAGLVVAESLIKSGRDHSLPVIE